MRIGVLLLVLFSIFIVACDFLIVNKQVITPIPESMPEEAKILPESTELGPDWVVKTYSTVKAYPAVGVQNIVTTKDETIKMTFSLLHYPEWHLANTIYQENKQAANVINQHNPINRECFGGTLPSANFAGNTASIKCLKGNFIISIFIVDQTDTSQLGGDTLTLAEGYISRLYSKTPNS